METSHHRVEGQSVKCGFGLQGVCCRLCSNGPCRITPEAPHGICGASADVIVARNFLRAVASGSGCYIHVIETTALNLKQTALAKGEIKGMNALKHLCGLFGIRESDPYTEAAAVAQAVLDDLYLPDYVPMKLQQKLAYGPRLEKWRELGILPGGAKSEVCAGVVKCSTNLNSDPVMGFSLLSMSEFFVFRKMETCETKNHPLCGCESRSYTKSPFRFIIEVSKPLSKKGKVIYMAKKANDLAHTKWMCKYHIVFTPKYRRKVIYNQYKEDLRDILKQLCSYKGVEILEGKLMPDHVHMLVAIPPKYSVSSFMGYLKGKSALMMFDRHANLKYKFGNRHFWSEGYYVSTVGLNEDTIRKYIKEQERYDQMVDKLSVKEYEDPFKG